MSFRINTFTKPAIKRRSFEHPREAHDDAWGRRIFKAPQLANPRAIFDQLPFTVHRPAGMRVDKHED
jgi:hypothetical protein